MKLFTAIIYCHTMVIPSFCVIKPYYLGNYHGMAVNYHGIVLLHLPKKRVCFKCQTYHTIVIFCVNLTLEIVGLKLTQLLTTVLFYNIGTSVIKLFKGIIEALVF